MSVNALLSDGNWLKASPLSQIFNAKDSFINLESTTGSKAGSDAELNKDADLFLGVLVIEVD